MRPGIWVSFLLLSLGSFQLGHHRIITSVNRNIHLFLIPMPFCTFCAFGLFVLFESSCMPLFLNFYSGSSIHSVLLCERCIDFSAHGRRRTLAILYSYGSVLCFDTYCFLTRFWLLFAFWISILGMGSFKYNILFTLLPLHGSFAVTP